MGTQAGTRRRGRELALQALYAVDTAGMLGRDREALERALTDFWGNVAEGDEADAGEAIDQAARTFAEHLVRGVAAHAETIDAAVTRASRNWRLERMARVDRNLLRLATYELAHEPETPPRVVINEAIEVAKRFGTSESAAFVNGILDRIAHDLGAEPSPRSR